jgi:hypothetical protein
LDEKSKFITTWNKAWNFLYRLTPAMLTSFIILSFASGVLTWYGITYLKLIEKNTLLYPLFSNFGVKYIVVYDLFASLISIGFYVLTKKYRLVCTIPIMIIYILTFLNFLNDFGFTIKIGIFQNITGTLGLDTIKKILGG